MFGLFCYGERGREICLPFCQLPDLRLHGACLDADLSIDANRLLEMGHGNLRTPGVIKKIGQVVVQGGFAMAVTL